jgi:mRNA interferase YafQ
MKVVWNNSFKRAFKKLIKKNPQLQESITNVLISLSNDPFTPSLKTHKLSGNLEGYWSSSVTYDCRIVFIWTENDNFHESLIILVDIGSHDQVY